MSNEQWWKAGPFMDSDGQEYWSVRRSPIGLGVAECQVAGCVKGKIWVSCTVDHGDWLHPEADRFGCNGGMRDCPECKGTGLGPEARALLFPAAATEGGEGA